MLLHYLLKRRKQKLHFSSYAVLEHCLNSTSCLISSIFLTQDSYSRCCTKSCNQYVQLWDCWGHGSAERKSIVLQQLDCVAHSMHQCAVFWVSYLQGNAEGDVGKQSIMWFLTVLVTLLPKIIIISSWYVKIIASRRWDVFLRHCVQQNRQVTLCLGAWIWKKLQYWQRLQTSNAQFPLRESTQ